MADMSACPACAATPLAQETARRMVAGTTTDLILSLPAIHCAACIAGVERTLEAEAHIQSARVNLTLKRVSLTADPDFSAAQAVEILTAAGFEAHEMDPGQLSATQTDRTGRDLLMRLAVAGFAMMNVMLLSVAVWSGAEGLTRDLFHWVSAIITVPAVGFCGMPFYRNAFAALKVARLNMDVPITLALILAVGTSLWETMLSGQHAYFDAALTLCFFLLTGRYLDYRTRAAARSAAEELSALEVPRALRITDKGEEEVLVADLAPGDLIRVKPGGRMPVDGIIMQGASELDRSFLTGETLPIPAEPGQTVSAGEINLTGPLTIRATAVGRETSLAQIADLVAVAESGRAQYRPLADRAAQLYAPGVHILAALAFFGWLIWSGDLRIALNIAAAVLIITCPCALGLAVPAVTTAASGKLFRKGLLIKDGTALERLAQVDTVALDKTGTLTTGALSLINQTDISPIHFAVARGLADGSSHPLAAAICAAGTQDQRPQQITDRTEVPGYGVQGRWRKQEVRLGRASWVGAQPGMHTATWLKIGDAAPVPFTFADALRPGAAQAVAGLITAGLEVEILSGDASPVVSALAAELGVTRWQAELLPQDKAARLDALRAKGHKVLMVGDGLNDTAALTAAHVSLSPASALDAARVASDMVLLGTDMSPLPGAVTLAKTARRRIKQNFRLATWYNVLAVPLAIAGLCSPLIAALAMSSSSITVSLNALRLKG